MKDKTVFLCGAALLAVWFCLLIAEPTPTPPFSKWQLISPSVIQKTTIDEDGGEYTQTLNLNRVRDSLRREDTAESREILNELDKILQAPNKEREYLL